MLGELRALVRLVYEKASDDNIFFLASGMTFGILVAAVPFLLLLLTVAGVLLAPQFAAPESAVLDWLWRLLPVAGPDVRAELGGTLEEISSQAGSLGLVSGALFVWFSTRLFGSLRTVLGEVFDLREQPGVVRGKVLDVGMVVLSTVLLCGNIALTSVVGSIGAEGLEGLEALGISPSGFDQALGLAVAFLFIYLMFLIIYKFVSLNRIPWRTAALAALVASLSFEILKSVFGWWVANYADYSNVFFGVATLIVLVISVYYGSALFVLGGEVAQVLELRRTLRRQREMFEGA